MRKLKKERRERENKTEKNLAGQKYMSSENMSRGYIVECHPREGTTERKRRGREMGGEGEG